jgi:hypothetical protein
MEIHVLLKSSSLPDVRRWQQAITAAGFDLTMEMSLSVRNNTGFTVAVFKGIDSGFEFDVFPASDTIDSYPEGKSSLGDGDLSANFRWSDDLREMACALITSAVLAQLSGGVWFDPQDGVCIAGADAIKTAQQAIIDAAL